MNRNLCKKVLDNGGTLTPLIIPSKETGGTGLMNPSVFLDGEFLLLNLRHVNYTLYHCEAEQVFQNRYGPLSYLNPENDITLRTTNFLCLLHPEVFLIEHYGKIDTSKLDIKPIWEFIGLEDGRLVKWDERLWLCGVRRDVKDNGEGRMELSEVISANNSIKEISRFRIEPPNDPSSYCEKNWMPVLDLPYHFVKWTNPTEVVQVDISTLSSKTIFQSTESFNLSDLRGSSQVIPYKDYRICVTHELNFFRNKLEQKDATYLHRFIIWDKDWKIVKITEPFSFMTGEIEFCCGMTLYKEDLLVTFGFQDNAAYLLKIPKNFIDIVLELREEDRKEEYWRTTQHPMVEITTSIPEKGCSIDCVFCPQRVLTNSYKGEKTLSLKNFKKIIDKFPKEIKISFAGFSEPWLNRNCTDMLLYASQNGHQVSAFTTAVGMELKDVEKIKDISFSSGPNSGFTLHLPDNEGYSKIPITSKYLEVLEALKNSKLDNFYLVCMGTVHDEIKHIFPEAFKQEMWSRAGNLQKEQGVKPELLYQKYRAIDNGRAPVTCNCEEKLYHNILLPNGDLALCCQDYSLKHILGNLLKQEYNNIIPEPNTPFELCRFCENAIKI